MIMLVWIASYPRSENSVFRRLLDKVYGVPTNTIYGERRRSLQFSGSDTTLKKMAESSRPFFLKTHEKTPADDSPAIYLVRDGRDWMVSYAHFVLHEEVSEAGGTESRERFEAVLKDLIEQTQANFGTWSENVLRWIDRPKTVVVRFEELIAAAEETIKQAIALAGLQLEPLPIVKVPSFEHLHSKNLPEWPSGLVAPGIPTARLRTFWKRNESAMRRLGYGSEKRAYSA